MLICGRKDILPLEKSVPFISRYSLLEHVEKEKQRGTQVQLGIGC